MTRHVVETCPDDLTLLRDRLDEIAEEGARIVSVLWQGPRGADENGAALQAGGSYVIVSEADFTSPLRPRRAELGEDIDIGTATPLAQRS